MFGLCSSICNSRTMPQIASPRSICWIYGIWLHVCTPLNLQGELDANKYLELRKAGYGTLKIAASQNNAAKISQCWDLQVLQRQSLHPKIPHLQREDRFNKNHIDALDGSRLGFGKQH